MIYFPILKVQILIFNYICCLSENDLGARSARKYANSLIGGLAYR